MRFGLALTLVVSLLSLVSCGGEESLTESEYRAAGNELCEEWLETLSALSAEAADGTDEELFEFTRNAGQLADDYLERLLDLPVPDSLISERAAVQERLAEFDDITSKALETQVDVSEIRDAGKAVDEALRNVWSGCRDR